MKKIFRRKKDPSILTCSKKYSGLAILNESGEIERFNVPRIKSPPDKGREIKASFLEKGLLTSGWCQAESGCRWSIGQKRRGGPCGRRLERFS
jgi:hypothetical protein